MFYLDALPKQASHVLLFIILLLGGRLELVYYSDFGYRIQFGQFH